MDTEHEPPRGATAVNGELEVGFDAEFEAAWSRVERIGRWAMLLVVVAGLAGALGAGPLDHRTLAGSDGTAIDYQPVARFGTATQITLHLPPGSADHDVTVRLGSTFFEPLGVRGITPLPARETSADGGLEAVFVARGTAGLVRPDGKPSRIGPIPLAVTIGDARPLRFSEFVLP